MSVLTLVTFLVAVRHPDSFSALVHSCLSCILIDRVRSFVLSGVAVDCWQSFDLPSASAEA